jgi:ribosome-associated translation inhibitor RaiA
MRLIVEDEAKQFDQQTHAYAEYRAFSSLVGTNGSIESVTLTLTRRSADAAEDDGRVVCTIAVRLTSGEVAEARAVARHAYAAIDRAVSLVRRTPSIVAATPVDDRNVSASRESA